MRACHCCGHGFGSTCAKDQLASTRDCPQRADSRISVDYPPSGESVPRPRTIPEKLAFTGYTIGLVATQLCDDAIEVLEAHTLTMPALVMSMSLGIAAIGAISWRSTRVADGDDPALGDVADAVPLLETLKQS